MRTTRLATAALVAGIAASVAACGQAPWADGRVVTASMSSTPVPSRTFGADVVAPSSPSPTATPVVNDLARGSTERGLTAGAVSATVTYWSDLPMDRWKPGAAKPLSLSLSATVTPDDGQGVYLQRVTLTVVPDTGDALAPQDDTSGEPHGYVVLSPYSYSQTFSIGTAPADATSLTVQLRYEFLVQATPTSEEFSKQTATDTLTIALVAG